jgi:hypothetical protein
MIFAAKKKNEIKGKAKGKGKVDPVLYLSTTP